MAVQLVVMFPLFSTLWSFIFDRMEGQMNPKSPWWQPPLLFFAKLNGWIVGPIILALVIGRWLDRRNNSDPWWTLTCIGGAFVISIAAMLLTAKRELPKLMKNDDDQRDGTNSTN